MYTSVVTSWCVACSMSRYISPTNPKALAAGSPSNAAEAMPDGGKILISTECRHVSRHVGSYEEIAEGAYVILSVADTGIAPHCRG